MMGRIKVLAQLMGLHSMCCVSLYRAKTLTVKILKCHLNILRNLKFKIQTFSVTAFMIKPA